MYTLPASLTYDWATYSGIPGGIPNRTTVYTTLTTANTIAQINAAIAACPVGQVVALASGNYNISGISRKSGITIRGAGAGQTVINSGGSVAFNYTGSSFNYDTGHQAIASGYTKGSTSITMATTPGAQFAVGRLIMINQDDDNTLVFHRSGNWAGTRNLRHVSLITNITGNVITFSSPLPYTFVAARNPGAQAIACSDSLFGVENMTIDALSCVRFLGSDRCWVKDCEIRGFDNEGIFVRDSHQIEIRRCYFHDCDGFPSQADGYAVYSQYAVSCLRMEDCIGYQIAYGTVMNGNDSSAFLYNYMWHMGRDAASRYWQQPGFNCNHGPHSIMSLWEGNMAERWQNDAYHGSASHQTLFRNHIHGVNPAYTLDRRIMDFCRTSYYFNAVGNIIGADNSSSPNGVGWNPNYYEYPATTYDRNHGTIYLLGWPNMGSGSLTQETVLTGFTPPGGSYPDTNVAATLTRHANYDYYNDAVQYSDADHTIADSLVYTSKPAYFGSLTWPPIDPFTHTVNKTPSKYRWDAYVASSTLSDLFADAPVGTYWVSPTGAATWQDAESATPLSGTACCSLDTACSSAHAGDTIYLRGGTYTIGSVGVAVGIEPHNSGTAGNPITFSAYGTEIPIIAQAGLTWKCYAILLNGISYVKITGIRFHNFQQYGCWIYGGGSYNEISYCWFYRDDDYDAGDRIIVIGGVAVPWSTHNWIHHNYLQGHHNTDPCSEAIDIIKVGGAQSSPAYSEDDYNTIEYNYLEYSGHANIVTYSKRNVIRNNTSHNEPWLTGCTSYRYGTSTTSLSISAGSKTLTTQTGLSLTAGYPISLISTANSAYVMWGTITSYTSGTGVLVVNITKTGGSGSYASWYVCNKNAPVYENATYDGKYGHRCSCFGDSDISHDNWNLIEGNRFGFAGVNPNNGGPSNLDIESPRNIVRFNYVYGGMASGMYFKSATGEPTLTGGVNNRVYNNTVYHNGYGWDETLYGALNVTYNGNGIAQHSNSGDTNNVIKNNIVYDNAHGDICWLGTATPPQTPWAGDVVENNLTGTDPRFIDPILTDATSQNLIASAHGYTSNPVPDLRLGSSSPAINAGTYLTLANGGGTNSTTLIVDDADYFQDGTRGSSLSTIDADWIAVGTVGNIVQISSINYATNTITLASAITWSDNAPVWLYKDSTGRRVLYGAAPDIGADAYVPGVPIGFIHHHTVVLTVSANEVAKLYVDMTKKRVVTGGSVVYTVHAEPWNDFTGNITLDISGLPANATDAYSVNPITETGTSNVTVTTTGVALGTHRMYITGTSAGGDVASVTVVLEIVADADADIKVPIKYIRAKQGDDAVFTIEADPLPGYTSDIDLSASGVPSGATASFGDSSLAYNGITTMTVDTGTATVGRHEIIITGEGPA